MGDERDTPDELAARAERLKRLRATAPHWQQPKPLEKRNATPPNDDDITAGIMGTIARIMARLERNRTTTERERQRSTEDA